jgi:hypothetical protein
MTKYILTLYFAASKMFMSVNYDFKLIPDIILKHKEKTQHIMTVKGTSSTVHTEEISSSLLVFHREI